MYFNQNDYAVFIGPYAVGEVPQSLGCQFVKKSDQSAIDLSGFSVKVVIKQPDDIEVTTAGTLDDGPTGQVSYQWNSDDLDAAGRYVLQFWVDDGTNLLASQVFVFDAYANTTAPTFP